MTPSNEHPDETTNVKQYWQPVWDWINTTGFQLMIAVAIIFAIGVGFLAYKVDNWNDRAEVLTVGILTIMAIVLSAVSTVTARETVEVMKNQESEMAEQRKIMAMQAEIMDTQSALMEQGLRQTKELFDLVERPVIAATSATVPHFNGRTPLIPVVAIENRGRTEGHELKLYVRVFYSRKTDDFPTYLDIAPLIIDFLPTGAGETFTFDHNRPTEITVEEFKKAVGDGNEAVFICGYGEYWNVNRTRGYSMPEFAFRFKRDAGFVRDYRITALWKTLRHGTKGASNSSENYE